MAKSTKVKEIKEANKNFFRSYVEQLKDEDTTIMADGLGSAEFTGHVDTGCLAFNALVSGTIWGGIPNNSATCIAGDPATGKTFFVLGILKHFLQNDPMAGVYLAETESAIREEMAANRGLDTARIIRTEPSTLQQFRHGALQFLDAYAQAEDRPKVMMALDSLGMLSSTKEMEDSLAGSETKDMTKAQLVKAIFRVLRLKMAKLQVPMLITNHVYAQQGGQTGKYAPPKVISGGSGPIYAADTIITLAKKKMWDEDTKSVPGNFITATAYKARLARENMKVELKLSYDTGLDKYHGLFDIAKDGGLLTKKGNKWAFPNGSSFFISEIEKNPEQVYDKATLDDIESIVNKNFMYGTEAAKKAAANEASV